MKNWEFLKRVWGNILKTQKAWERGGLYGKSHEYWGRGVWNFFWNYGHLASLAKCNPYKKAQLWGTTTYFIINGFSSVTTNDTVTKLYTEFMYGRFENILYTKYTRQMANCNTHAIYSPNNLVRSVVGTMWEETVQYSQRTMKNIAFCYFTYVSKQKQTRPLVKRAILQNWQMLSLLLCDVMIFYGVWRESLL